MLRKITYLAVKVHLSRAIFESKRLNAESCHRRYAILVYF